MIIPQITIRNQHINIIKFSSLRFMNSRNYYIRSRYITKIFHRRLKDKFLKISEVFHFINLLEKFDATLYIR